MKKNILIGMIFLGNILTFTSTIGQSNPSSLNWGSSSNASQDSKGIAQTYCDNMSLFICRAGYLCASTQEREKDIPDLKGKDEKGCIEYMKKDCLDSVNVNGNPCGPQYKFDSAQAQQCNTLLTDSKKANLTSITSCKDFQSSFKNTAGVCMAGCPRSK